MTKGRHNFVLRSKYLTCHNSESLVLLNLDVCVCLIKGLFQYWPEKKYSEVKYYQKVPLLFYTPTYKLFCMEFVSGN
jgi:hypothetical protein